MPMVRKKGHHSKLLDDPLGTDQLPPLESSRVSDQPYAEDSAKHDALRRKFMNDLTAAIAHKPMRHERTKKYRVYRTASDYLDDFGHERSEVYPLCANCGSVNTHRIDYQAHSYKGKEKVLLENYCGDCGKFSKYVFKHPEYLERDDAEVAKAAEAYKAAGGHNLREAVQTVVDYMQQMVEDEDDETEDLEEAAADGHELVRKLRREGEEQEANVVCALAMKLDKMVDQRKAEERARTR